MFVPLQELSEPGEGFQEALEALADAEGITEVAVTELCTPLAKPEDYVRAVQACVNVEKCVGVTVWGIADKASLDYETRKKGVLTCSVGFLELLAVSALPAALG